MTSKLQGKKKSEISGGQFCLFLCAPTCFGWAPWTYIYNLSSSLKMTFIVPRLCPTTSYICYYDVLYFCKKKYGSSEIDLSLEVTKLSIHSASSSKPYTCKTYIEWWCLSSEWKCDVDCLWYWMFFVVTLNAWIAARTPKNWSLICRK